MGNSPSIYEKASLLRDAVFAADDGIITTFAVVAGSTGAGLHPSIAVILGFANLFADGFSMATGIYMGVKSEQEYEKAEGSGHWRYDSPFKNAIVTYFSFVIAGLFPVLPYLFKMESAFVVSCFVVGLSLFAVGILKGIYTKKHWLRSGIEMLAIGGISAILAYSIGYLLDTFVV